MQNFNALIFQCKFQCDFHCEFNGLKKINASPGPEKLTKGMLRKAIEAETGVPEPISN